MWAEKAAKLCTKSPRSHRLLELMRSRPACTPVLFCMKLSLSLREQAAKWGISRVRGRIDTRDKGKKGVCSEMTLGC